MAVFSSGTVIFDADGNVGMTSLKSGTISLSTDNPFCVASPSAPCRYTINKIDLVAKDVTVGGTPAENIHAFNWYPAVGVVDDGTGMRLTVPPGMAFNVSGDIKKKPVVFTVAPTQPNTLSLVIDPVLQKITIMGSLSGTQQGFTLKLTVHATSNAPFANVPPVAHAGSDQKASTDCFAAVSLDKSKTFDPNGDLAFSYYTENGYSIGDGTTPVAFLPGKHRLTLNAFDQHGARATDDVVIDVVDDGTTKPVAGATLFKIETPPAVAVDDTGLLATDSLLFKPNAALKRVSQPSNAISLGPSAVVLSPNAEIQGDLWSVGPVQLFPNSQIAGTLHTASAIDTKPGAFIGGVDTTPAFSPFRVLSWNAVIPSQPGAPIVLGPNESAALDPGNFGDIGVGPGAALKLHTGTYTASSLATKPNAVVTVDDTNGPVILYLRGAISHKGTIAGVSGATKLLVTGNAADVAGPWVGTLLVPNGSAGMGPAPNRDYHGAVFAKSIQLQSVLVHESFSWDDVRAARQACAVTPVLLCVKQTGPNTYFARFEYENAVAFSGVRVPLGLSNRFSPSPEQRGQPEIFLPGIIAKIGKGAFEVPFDGNDLTWVLGGRSAAASKGSPPCL